MQVQVTYPIHTPWVIWWAVGLHVVWGTMLIVGDTGLIRLVAFVGLQEWIELGVAPTVLGCTLIAFAFLAACSLLRKTISNRTAFLMLLPQYFILLTALLSDAVAIVTGNVSGTPIDRGILIAVLFPIMFAAILHTFAILERHVWKL